MAQTWVALLRGVNVGGRAKVSMAELRRACEEAGLGDVRTFIQSGNLLFTSSKSRAALVALLERLLAESLGVPARAILRSDKEIAKVAGTRPFGADTSSLYVMFLADRPDREGVRTLAGLETGPEQFKVAGSEVYLSYPNGLGRAKLTPARFERALAIAGTARNWRTVSRLAELV
jgi:uncharacterized protein (DUF1697 family)